jgi:L-serine dehydratase
MVAARRFALGLERHGLLNATNRVRIDLYGSLALTGKGHGTDKAVILGLYGEEPATVKPQSLDSTVDSVRKRGQLPLLHKHTIQFREVEDIAFHCQETLPLHSNGMVFTALDARRRVLWTGTFYSIGGGFVISGDEPKERDASVRFPFPFRSAEELLEICRENDLDIWRLILRNECALRPEKEVIRRIDTIWHTMRESIERGMITTGILPGGLNVRRRAPNLAAGLRENKWGADTTRDLLSPLDWVSVFAMAVNEENAAGGRIVTAPTNGAAGVIPAVAHYYEKFVPESDHEGVRRFFLTTAAIGILYKENASISGAEVGCQGEVGVAASMAAGGLVAARGGNNEQVEHAAEIAMEHHLGMTCDPIGGLVQIPCIERNAMGAVKAINACRMAMIETGDHKVSLDQVIATMYRTGLDMQSRYKETSLAGLALNVIEC